MLYCNLKSADVKRLTRFILNKCLSLPIPIRIYSSINLYSSFAQGLGWGSSTIKQEHVEHRTTCKLDNIQMKAWHKAACSVHLHKARIKRTHIKTTDTGTT